MNVLTSDEVALIVKALRLYEECDLLSEKEVGVLAILREKFTDEPDTRAMKIIKKTYES